MDRPPTSRRLAAVAIDLGVLLLGVPVAVLALGVALSWLLYTTAGGDCPEPCDGPAMLGFGLAIMVLYLIWLAYYPVLAFWRRRTLGARLMGLRFEGKGLRRHLAWDKTRQVESP